MSNRLKNQSSPYLLQHAENPVHWYPWCEEAFEKAGRENKPIFLSIGYSTCHWCHVMAHESFENKETAEILNRYFVSIKVDREERPDIDSVYMEVCQLLTGSGGWPMSIFMTAEQKPFFAGTYFPPQSQYGMMGFRELLLAIADKWEKDRTVLLQSGNEVMTALRQKENGGCKDIIKDLDNDSDNMDMDPVKTELTDLAGEAGKLCDAAVRLFAQSFDRKNGGFGSAPKFPTPHNLIFLTLYSQIKQDSAPWEQVRLTLTQMRRGGIFDHIGGGFSRYSTDSYYLVPHFEKMLYDNALLMIAYSAAYKVSHEESFLDAAERTAQYVLREMTGPDGEFYSAQDADSEGEEGKFYVWSREEVCNVLGAEAGGRFCDYFNITEYGNFEGKNIPNLLNGNDFTDEFDREIQIMYQHRKKRGKLHLDDKVLTSWNSLMICAMSILYRVTGKQQYLAAAENACGFIEQNLAEGQILYVSCRNQVRSVRGFLDEYACYTGALISLYEVTAVPAYLERAEQVCREAAEQFADVKGRGYFLYGTKNSPLITRPKETYDGALPSGNSVMAYCLVRLFQLTDREDYRKMAERQLAFMFAEAESYPAGYCLFLTAFLMYANPPKKITAVLAGEDCEGKIIARLPLYSDVKMLKEETRGHRLMDGKTTYYVCKNKMCLPPTNDITSV